MVNIAVISIVFVIVALIFLKLIANYNHSKYLSQDQLNKNKAATMLGRSMK